MGRRAVKRRPSSRRRPASRGGASVDRNERERLRLGWCRPRGRGADGLPTQRELLPGEVLLVAWDGARSGGIFRTVPASAQALSVPWAPAAKRTLDLAERVVRLAAPLLGATPTTEDLRLDSACIPGLAEAERLEGPSFGASLFLALMSRALDRPVPGHLAASATIDIQGQLGRVDHIEEKLEAVLASAPGISTFVVGPGQNIASGLSKRLRAGRVKVTKVKDVDGLMSLAWPKLTVQSTRLEPAEAEALADRFYRFSLSRRGIVSWRYFKAAAERVRDALPEDSPAWGRADVASKVAARHAGESIALPLLEPAELAALHKPLRMKHLAQIVQSHSDAGSEQLAAVLDWASPQLPQPLDCSEEDLELRGAIGRALAVLGRRGEARALLEETVRLWSAIERACEGSLALCELIRLTGLAGPTASVEGTKALVQAVLDDARTDLVSESFLRLALGRAWVQAGAPARALKELEQDDFDWSLTREDVKLSRRRWLAAALRHLGRAPEAAAQLQAAAALGRRAKEPPTGLWLGRLDDALARGADPTEHVGLVVRQFPGLCQHLWRGRPVAERARIVAEEFPY